MAMGDASNLIVRPLDPERDLDGFLHVMSEIESVSWTAAEWRERERLAAPDAFRRRLVGELDGQIVALATVMDRSQPDTVLVRVAVQPAHRGLGYGRQMAAATGRLLDERAPGIIETQVADGDEASRTWAERRGFRATYTMTRSHLDLVDFDHVRHRPALDRQHAAGIWIEPPDDRDRFYDLYTRLLRDVPEEAHPVAREVFDRQLDELDVIVLIARDGANWVGKVTVLPVGQHGAWNGFTGVLPEYRGRGLARALKVSAIEELERRGRTWIETMNHSVNAPMLAVNRALGYRPIATVQYMRRA